MRFADIIGQEDVKDQLRRSVDRGRVSHAQMLVGMGGWGTLPMALAYIQYLNCTDRHDGDSCGKCPSCLRMEQMAHPDVHFVFPTSTPKGKSSSRKYTSDDFLVEWRDAIRATGGYLSEQAWYDAIKVDNKQGVISREEADAVISKLSLKSLESEYKSVLIWLPERCNITSANVLLKILEEPWEKTLFLLVSQRPSDLLPTVVSRVQQTELGRVPQRELELLAESLGVPDPAEAAHAADGDVIRLREISESLLSGQRGEDFERFASLMRLSWTGRHLDLIEWAENLAHEGREDIKRFLEFSAGFLREIFMISAGVPQVTYLCGPQAEFARKFAPFLDAGNIDAFISEIERALQGIRQNANPRITLVHLVLSVSKFVVRKQV